MNYRLLMVGAAALILIGCANAPTAPKHEDECRNGFWVRGGAITEEPCP